MLICTGIFIILASLAVFIFNAKYDLDTEKRVNVIVATKDIAAGEVIAESMVAYRTIKESAYSSRMVTQQKLCIGAKSSVPIKSGDYIFLYNILSPEDWRSNDARTIVLPMTIDERLVNLIRKGSIINIKVLPAEMKTLPRLVLSKITVSDVLDENGLSLGDALGSKKAYAVVVLNEEQRNRLYAAMQYGKLLYELYCDATQPADMEDFVIPPEYFGTKPSKLDVNPDSGKKLIPSGGGN